MNHPGGHLSTACGAMSCTTWYLHEFVSILDEGPRHQHFERHARGREALPSFEDFARSPLKKKLSLQTPFPHRAYAADVQHSPSVGLDTIGGFVTKITQQSNIIEHCVREQRRVTVAGAT